MASVLSTNGPVSVKFGGSKQGLSNPINELQSMTLFLTVSYNAWLFWKAVRVLSVEESSAEAKQSQPSHCPNAGHKHRQPQQAIVLSGTGR